MPSMKLDDKKPIILSIGGSLIVPSGDPDVVFLTKLSKLIQDEVKNGRRFVIVSGGGKTARHYIDAAVKVRHNIDPEDLDWLGIHATRLNGHLLRTIFREIAYPVVIKHPDRVPMHSRSKLTIAAGWKPGWSTDYVACRIAARLGTHQVINLTNIDHVYDADPRVVKTAKAVEAMRWATYRKMVGNKWDPGLSAPFDPVASRFCHTHHLSVAIVNGGELPRLSKLLKGESFTGTILS